MNRKHLMMKLEKMSKMILKGQKMTMKMNKFLVSAAVCGILAANIGVSASAEYLPSFVTGITTTAEDITDEITEIPEESIIDIT